jgi:predicted phosphoribosyltransferase
MQHGQRFSDRRDAGRRLGELLAERTDLAGALVVGMARGGVPVAAEVARRLDAPLDLVVVRKIGAPSQPEFAVGAIAEGEPTPDVEARSSEPQSMDPTYSGAATRAQAELESQVAVLRSQFAAVPAAGRTVILVDDGYATGHTAAAAARSLRRRGARRIVLAVPVCPAEAADAEPPFPADELICLAAPAQLTAVGFWYDDFDQVADAEVLETMRRARGADRPPAPPGVNPA